MKMISDTKTDIDTSEELKEFFKDMYSNANMEQQVVYHFQNVIKYFNMKFWVNQFDKFNYKKTLKEIYNDHSRKYKRHNLKIESFEKLIGDDK